jgi:undecaprenyl-diphosphatase
MSFLNRYFFDLIFSLARRNFLLDDLGIFLSQYLPYLLVLAFLVLIFKEKSGRRRVFLFCEGALSIILARGLLTEIIRFFYNHPRPFEALNFTPLIPEAGSSFPSGHAAFFFALSLVVFYVNLKWGIWFFILSSLNGLARILVGVHWPADILSGAVIGLLSAWTIHQLLKPYFPKLNENKSEEATQEGG